ncbi:serine acetyltransferase [Empedobacter falsenii]
MGKTYRDKVIINLTVREYYHRLREVFFINPIEIYNSLKYYLSLKLFFSNHLSIGIKKLGMNGTKFPHPIGIVIGKGVNIGQNCVIYQNVTIGVKSREDRVYPSIGNNVIISANCVIIGNITIGNNVTIGASAVVLKDIPDNSIVVGNPARIIN